MRGEPFTPATLRRVGGDEIPEGAFLLAATMAYRVDRVSGRTLHCLRWPLAEVPEDALTIAWTWAPRMPSRRNTVYDCCGIRGGCGGPCAAFPCWELTT